MCGTKDHPHPRHRRNCDRIEFVWDVIQERQIGAAIEYEQMQHIAIVIVIDARRVRIHIVEGRIPDQPEGEIVTGIIDHFLIAAELRGDQGGIEVRPGAAVVQRLSRIAVIGNEHHLPLLAALGATATAVVPMPVPPTGSALLAKTVNVLSACPRCRRGWSRAPRLQPRRHHRLARRR